MENMDFRVQPVRGVLQWMRIYSLYLRAFPCSERKPFHMIVAMHRRGRADVWVARAGTRFAGFATTINGENMVLLDYLAVRDGMRNCGCGSAMLDFMKTAYAGRGMLVEIEDAFAPGNDLSLRRRRRAFYLKNGFVSQRVMASVFGVRMEILCREGRMDFNGYREFYRTQYSEFAAKNIQPAVFPAEEAGA